MQYDQRKWKWTDKSFSWNESLFLGLYGLHAVFWRNFPYLNTKLHVLSAVWRQLWCFPLNSIEIKVRDAFSRYGNWPLVTSSDRPFRTMYILYSFKEMEGVAFDPPPPVQGRPKKPSLNRVKRCLLQCKSLTISYVVICVLIVTHIQI